jgi:hypothetical protein
MTTSIKHYESFLAHRARAERAIGRHIVSEIEAGRSIDGLVYLDTGIVKGTDMEPAALITIARVSHVRTLAALKSLKSLGNL